MKKGLLAALVCLAVVCALAAAPAMAADVSWSKGDSWTYSMSTVQEGLSLTGTIEMSVTKVDSNYYTMDVSGSATMSGSYNGTSVSGTAAIKGTMTRSTANFGSVSTALIMNMSMTVSGLATFTIQFGSMVTATPALNDLPLNQVLAPGTHIWSNSTISGTGWYNMAGLSNTSETISDTEHLELIVGANETVTTPAGTFECVKLSGSSDSDSISYYYSEKVGNYVKMTGPPTEVAGYAAFGNLTLESYSYSSGSSGIMSYITGQYWWVTALIVVIIVVIVVGLLMMRRRGRAAQPAAPPAQPAPPPPPPQ